MKQILAQSKAQPRLSALLLSVFAAMALILAAVGIYGVMAYSVAQRTHEMGIRMALGAGRGTVLRMVMKQCLLLALIGTAIGGAGSLLLTRLMGSLLFAVHPNDLVTLAGVSILLIAVAIAAGLVPARRATKVDPMIALRYE
jgi:putative ABC transport system permease protein